MCGRYFIDPEVAEDMVRIINEIQNKLNTTPRTGEIFPTNTAPVLKWDNENEQCVVDIMKWGFPKWDGKGSIINARSETAPEKRMFKKPLMETRMVVPTTGFYEWKTHENAKKEKYLFRKPGDEMLYLAGIYGEFQGESCFTILTTAANSSMVYYHNRMPVLLDRDEINAWLQGYTLNDVIHRVPVPVEGAIVS